ncbi:GLPGLI family protein [Kaistella flava (ex Peng et al. 2021)]|uniref:GLPGLI family protein n=1 Tax=Kaistella flava (ex Peng et al. 2021) TaxID=2038776 RepID=A0A7M2Y8T3_9FLAO|nr:GLPGLI family protein [Kaistella flava (ex Peng et al. 2021)]QOW09812.1 GLPGLI family protein [Kaistella flava (ex Peng et al. 2021)]
MKNPILKALLLILLALLSHNYFYGQSYKIIYEMTWKPSKDSTDYEKELMSLVTNEKEPSYFQSYDKFRYDSLKTKLVKDYMENGGESLRFPNETNQSKYRTFITKDVLNNTISAENKFYTSVFLTKYKCQFKWKINNTQSQNILGYKTYNATTSFGGRNWTAWYTTDIPIPDGPYKFYGLPGLILKISDSSGDYDFEIKGITKEKNDISRRAFSYKKAVELTPKQWTDFWKKYKKQPSMILENLNTTHTTYVINGKDVNSREVKDEYDKKEWEIINNFENPIELTPTCD